MSRRSLVIAAVVSGLLIGGLVVLRARWTDDLLAQWHAKLAQAGPSEAAELLARAIDGGELGLTLAVASLGAPQPHVAEAAHEAISTQLDRIASEPDASTAWPQSLAAELARQTPNFDRPGRRRAADLALKMLTALQRKVGEDRTRLTAHCRRVVELYDEPVDETKPGPERAPASKSGSATGASDSGAAAAGAAATGVGAPALATPAATSRDETARRLPSAAELLSPDRLATLAPSDAGRLHPCPTPASDSTASPSSDRAAESGGSASVNRPEPGVPARNATGAPPTRRSADQAADATDAAGDPTAAALRPMSLGAAAAGSVARSPSADPAGSSPAGGRSWASTNVRDLIGLLRGSEAQAARQELQRRGFGPVELALAEKMVDPDPQARKQLARLLPQMTSIEPHRWLLWLCRDDDAEVRLTAVSLLATCGNPAVLAEVEHLAAADADPRVRRCGEQISARRAAAPTGPTLR